ETSEEFTLNTQGFSVGSHVITLKVTDDDGEVGVTTITISLAKANVPPIADAGEDVTVKEGSSVSLSAEGSSDPDGEIESYEWSEGGTVFSLEKNVEKNFSVGVHTITLQVIDDEGASSTDTVVVTVEKENLPPKADAGEDIVVTEGVSVHLSAKGSSDPDGNITSYAWLMPDGKTVTKPEFNVTFPTGKYEVLLNITDDKGAVSVDEITVTVNKRPGTLERIRSKYISEIKITLLTLVALTCSVVIFLRSQRERGLY
ncbi:MAG: PKD domain-containing protein, partial [Candidatus Hydrothermarchaeales archaeon]